MSMRVSPEALVGRQLRVYWVMDDAWFAGSVESWDPATARHKVRGYCVQCGGRCSCTLVMCGSDTVHSTCAAATSICQDHVFSL